MINVCYIEFCLFLSSPTACLLRTEKALTVFLKWFAQSRGSLRFLDEFFWWIFVNLFNEGFDEVFNESFDNFLTNFLTKFIWLILLTSFFDNYFLMNFFEKFIDKIIDKFFDDFLTNALTYNLLSIARFRIGVPLILFSLNSHNMYFLILMSKYLTLLYFFYYYTSHTGP